MLPQSAMAELEPAATPSVLAAATASPAPSPTATPSIAPAASSATTATRTTRPRAGAAASGVAGTTAGGAAFGIAGNLSSLSPAQIEARLDGIAALGVGWVRYDIEWSNIEYAGPGQYNWADYDKVVRAVSARGLRSLAIIDYTPGWARRGECSGTAMCAPADPAAYARFAAAAVARYSPMGVKHWEVWNEPNNQQFFQPGANASQYTALLKAAYTAIKRADPGATVLTGGTSPADTGGGMISPPDFVRGIYDNGGKGFFDAVAHHPYTYPFSPAWTNPEGAWGQLETIHGIMAARGDGGKKIWMTEYGAPTGGPGRLASSGMTWAEGGSDHVTEGLQVKIVGDAVALSMRSSWLGPLFWYTYQDPGTTSDTVENFFGLTRADGSRKPAWQAFRDAVGRY